MLKYDIIELSLETKERDIPEDIERYCLDRIDDCYIAVMATAYTKEDARAKLKEYRNEIKEVGKVTLATTHVIEIYEADEDGEFVEGSDYDW